MRHAIHNRMVGSLLITTLFAFLLLKYILFKDVFNSIAWLDNVAITPLLILWLVSIYYWPVKGNNRLVVRLFMLGSLFLILGNTFNTAASLVNGGRFPVVGYTVDEFVSHTHRAAYYFRADSTTPLSFLGDHAVLSGCSIGDITALSGAVTLTVIYFVARRRHAER